MSLRHVTFFWHSRRSGKTFRSSGKFSNRLGIKREKKDAGLYVLYVDYGSPAYYRWKKYCQPDGIEPAEYERSDPRYLSSIVFEVGVPLHLLLLLHLEVFGLLSLYAPLRHVDLQPGSHLPALPAFQFLTYLLADLLIITLP